MKERRVEQNSQEWLMGSLLMKVKIVIDYLENLKNENYSLTKIFIMRQDINYRK